jgi:uncharacterized phage-associated protein
MFYAQQQRKIGNLLVYLASRQKPLPLTKALKLIYLIDEKSIKETGVPVTWLDYEVWKNGPVPRELFDDITGTTQNVISNFVKLTNQFDQVKSKNVYILNPSVKSFEDDDFSIYEIQLVASVIDEFSEMSDLQVLNYLRKNGSMWQAILDRYELKDKFYKYGASDVKIPLKNLILGKLDLMGAHEAAKASKSIFERFDGITKLKNEKSVGVSLSALDRYEIRVLKTFHSFQSNQSVQKFRAVAGVKKQGASKINKTLVSVRKLSSHAKVPSLS